MSSDPNKSSRSISVAKLKKEIELLKKENESLKVNLVQRPLAVKRPILEHVSKAKKHRTKVVINRPKVLTGAKRKIDKKKPIKKEPVSPTIMQHPTVLNQAEIVKEEKIHIAERSGFELKEERTFQDVAKELTFQPAIMMKLKEDMRSAY